MLGAVAGQLPLASLPNVIGIGLAKSSNSGIPFEAASSPAWYASSAAMPSRAISSALRLIPGCPL